MSILRKKAIEALSGFTQLASGNRDLNASLSDSKASGVLSTEATNSCMAFLMSRAPGSLLG